MVMTVNKTNAILSTVFVNLFHPLHGITEWLWLEGDIQLML